jgi:hypothetical protein
VPHRALPLRRVTLLSPCYSISFQENRPLPELRHCPRPRSLP